MPPTCYTIKHESLGPGPATYPSSIHQSEAPHALSNPITIFLDPPSNGGIQLSPLVSPEPGLPLEEIPQAINLIPHRPEVTQRHQFQARPRKSIERPGGTSKSIRQKARPFGKPRKEVHRTYTREFKLQVLSFCLHQKISVGPTTTRSPTVREASARYLVPRSTIQDWKKPETMELILNGTKGTRSASGIMRTRGCHWPEMEELLYEAYRIRREERKSVRRSWLRRAAKAAFQRAYPTLDVSIFIFSNGWFFGFLARHDITLRFATNKSQKIPADYLHVCLEFVRFVRRNAQLRENMQDELLVVGRYLLSCICNMDETPLPFEFLDGQTYADRGSHTVQIRSTRSGWDKRQATILLCIFADGAMRVKPLILFKGALAENLTRRADRERRAAEIARYDPRVLVQFNPNAYANESVLVNWIIDMLVPALPSGPRLLALDVAKFHKTDAVLDTLRSHDIIPAMIPPGCTGLMQPLDVAVNKPLKDILRALVEDALDLYENRSGEDLRESSRPSAVEDRRVLVQHCLADAWEIFCTTKRELIVSSFRKVGLALPIDGSCDDELSIKGIPPADLIIGDWQSGHAEIEGWGNPGGPGDETRNILAGPVKRSGQGAWEVQGAQGEAICGVQEGALAWGKERELDAADDEVGEFVDRFDCNVPGEPIAKV